MTADLLPAAAGSGARSLSVSAAAWRAARAVLVEVWWWIKTGAGFVRRAPIQALVWVGLLVFTVAEHLWLPAAVITVMLALPALWCRFGPISYWLHVTRPRLRRIRVKQLRRSWPAAMEACGLSRRTLDRQGQPAVAVPQLGRPTWQEPSVLVIAPALLLGQTVDDVTAAADRLRVCIGSRQIRIVPNDTHTACSIRFLFGDPLEAPILLPMPSPDATPSLGPAHLGITEDGTPWQLPIAVHTLTAGSTGSGKASAMWCVLAALAPAIHAGLVQVHGIDLKGGVEQAMGQALFTRSARTLPAAVELLEDAAAAMQLRLDAIAGHSRTHIPTVDEPLVLVVIDELAMLTSYSTERDLIKRADVALRALLALGRAPGYVVHGYLQDPRKDTLPQRHLFPQSYALRLKEREEVAMVLSEGAVAAGAACHKIPRSMPGVGYYLDENSGLTRVRLFRVDDHHIRQLAATFPASVQVPRKESGDQDHDHDDDGDRVGLASDAVHDEPAPRTRQPRTPRTTPRTQRTPRAGGAGEPA